ncbi:MAG: hypothetical protein CW691_09960 [Candidatus Bathyarchaeum sp.]|nr:MAG: hypothetical protein CW691_09960 [Candidatus Bathyarchaeum sp.]
MSEIRHIAGMEYRKTMLIVLITCIWSALLIYSVWFFFSAKTVQPLTLNEFALKYKLHKQKTKCNARRIQIIFTKNKEIVGFKCECGHNYIQKRLLSQKISKHIENSQESHASYKITRQLEMKWHLRAIGLQYSSIKKI